MSDDEMEETYIELVFKPHSSATTSAAIRRAETIGVRLKILGTSRFEFVMMLMNFR